jgi:hypothetical protein
MKTDTPNTWVTIDVLNSKGVVAKLYSGPGLAPGAGLWTKPWGGTDSKGNHLPTGNYKYRVRVAKGGSTATATGTMLVCKSYFAILAECGADQGDSPPTAYYIYKGPLSVYSRFYLANGYWTLGRLYYLPVSDGDAPLTKDVPGGGENSTGAAIWQSTYRCLTMTVARAERWYWRAECADNTPGYPYDFRNGSKLFVTVVQ